MPERASRAVVLARGTGSRMRAGTGAEGLSASQAEAAGRGAKAMMPLAGRPFLDHSLTALADAGISSVCLVIGPGQSDVRAHYAAVAAAGMGRLRVGFAVQQRPLGTCDAVRAAADFCGDDRFVVVNGDTHYPPDALRALLAEPGLATVGFDRAALSRLGNIPAERVAAFALLEVAGDGSLAGVVEKPTAAQAAALGPSAPVSMNCWLLGPEFFAVAGQVRRSVRGEYELPDAVRLLIERGERIAVRRLAAGCLDLSGRADVATVTQALRGRSVRL